MQVNKTLNNLFIKVLDTLTRYELGQMIGSFSSLSYSDRVRKKVDWRATTIRRRNYCALRHKERSRFQWSRERERERERVLCNLALHITTQEVNKNE
jgi:hypothetical protein